MVPRRPRRWSRWQQWEPDGRPERAAGGGGSGGRRGARASRPPSPAAAAAAARGGGGGGRRRRGGCLEWAAPGPCPRPRVLKRHAWSAGVDEHGRRPGRTRNDGSWHDVSGLSRAVWCDPGGGGGRSRGGGRCRRWAGDRWRWRCRRTRWRSTAGRECSRSGGAAATWRGDVWPVSRSGCAWHDLACCRRQWPCLG